MPKYTQDIRFLRTVISGICEIDEVALCAFIDAFQPRILQKDENLIAEGDYGKSVAFIAEGLLRSYYISPKGEEFNKHFFLNGEFVAPLTSLVLGVPSPVYIGALETTRLLVSEFKTIDDLYNKHTVLNRLGRKIVEFAWIGKERRETQLIMLNATERYRAFLKEFSGLEKRIPQYHIASYLGITPVQLSRIRTNIK